MASSKAPVLAFHLFIIVSFHSVVPFSDDAAVMSKLLAAISPAPNDWSNSKDYCSWTYVTCDDLTRNVVSINVDSLSISGELVSEITQLSSLRNLSVLGNSLSGPLPSFANMSKLEELYLDGNYFSSVPMDFLLGLPNLKTFSISENGKLSPWKIPMHLTQSTQLVSFYANNANVFGMIPDFFDSFPNLENLTLCCNNLIGSLPGSFSRSEIRILRLDNQQQGLSGTINVLSSMIQLSQVWLHANAFTGQIPNFYRSENLFDLRLGDNQLTGLVPFAMLDSLELLRISLENNKLQGPMPQFESLVIASLGNNSFCKETPGHCDPQVTVLLNVASDLGYPITLAESWIGNDACKTWESIICEHGNVTTVNLGRRQFSGTISDSFADLTSLRDLILNDNNLTGPIPESLTTLPLQILDVSNNNLSGTVPVFPHSVNFIYSGNSLLRKNVTHGGSNSNAPRESPLGPTSSAPNKSPDGHSSSNGSSLSAGMITGSLAAVFILVLILFVSYKCSAKDLFKRFGRKASNQTTSSTIRGTAVPIQVLRKATNFFSQENVLGSGGYGVVYRGKLDDGTKVAVKRMKDGAAHTKEMKEFQAEISFVTKVRHRNLVSLLGYCINDNERLLVYEYMPQGTLGHHLFAWQKHCFDPLTWKQRVTIALDVARGIEYLHSLAHQSFIHRDIKPSNILLSDDMRAKVADFGLVRKAPDGKSSIETRVAGTFGYLAPEYATTGRVTTKVDVYAFGVVLMEILTGKKAVDETVPDEMCHLVTWFRKVISNGDNLRKAIDPTLDLDEQTFESISKVAELAGHCTAKKSFRRPNMEHVINVLGPLVQKWKPLSLEEIEERYGGLDVYMSLPLVFDDSSTQSLPFGQRPNQSAQF